MPPAPGEPSGTTTTSDASRSVGFSVPSMKPVRSRSWRYGQLDVSAATDASPATALIAPRPTSKTTSYALPESQSTASCCVAGIVNPSGPTISSLKPARPAGASRRHDLAPQLWSEAGDEVHAPHRRPRFPERGDRRHETTRVVPARRIELEIGMRRRPECEDAALRAAQADRLIGDATEGRRTVTGMQRLTVCAFGYALVVHPLADHARRAPERETVAKSANCVPIGLDRSVAAP